jgi:hypothetical protein
MMRRFCKLWIVCSLVHLLAFGICMFFAMQIMDVSREPSAVALAAVDLGRFLLFPALLILADRFQFPLVVANSLLWGLAIAALLTLGHTVVVGFSRSKWLTKR